MRILIVGSIPRSLLNFRGPLLNALVSHGHLVWGCAKGSDPEVEEGLSLLDVSYLPITVQRTGLNPFTDICSLWQLIQVMKNIQPDVVLAYTIKPVIYAGVAARICQVPKIYSLITGLGHAFMAKAGLRHRFVHQAARRLYAFSLKYSTKVFFQNPDDISDFVGMGIVPKEKTVLVNGTGIDLDHYAFESLPKLPVFILVARLLADKGVREYAAAARQIKQLYPETRCLLVGDLDNNPSSIRREELERWINEGAIEYLGYQKDVRPALRSASVCVLPSYYREGVPRTLLEAMSMGRAVITSNAPGCRETVNMPAGVTLEKASQENIQGENGFLVPVKNVAKLVQAMEVLIVKPQLRAEMGIASRRFAEHKFAVQKINQVLLQEMGL